MSYDRSVSNYMRVSEARSSETARLFHIPGTKWTEDRIAEEREQELAPKRAAFRAWLNGLPETVVEFKW